ncbi:MAG: rhodanese-like domain-containing protein [Myxococcota bacterium]
MRSVVKEAGVLMTVAVVTAGVLVAIRGPAQPTVQAAAVCGAEVQGSLPVPAFLWIAPKDAQTHHQQGTALFLDARSDREFALGHIAGAFHVSIDHGVLPTSALDLVRDDLVVIAYCDTSNGCARSTRLAGLLSHAGAASVRVLEGGMPSWIDLGYAAEAGPCRSCLDSSKAP